jgi:uncharacterized membrane protein
MKFTTKQIVYSGAVAALYIIITLTLSPISYGPIQFRVANLLKPLVLFNPVFAIGFGYADLFANLISPFGAWDFIMMPLVDIGAGLLAWRLRKFPFLALVLQSIIISLGVCIFPLYLGGKLSPIITFIPVLIAQLIAILLGYILIWSRPDVKNIFYFEKKLL